MSKVSNGWRACIDHIIRPDSPCPVCEIETLSNEDTAIRWRLAEAETALLTYDPDRTNNYWFKHHPNLVSGSQK